MVLPSAFLERLKVPSSLPKSYPNHGQGENMKEPESLWTNVICRRTMETP